MKLELSQRLEPRLEQTLELVLSPKMLQMLKILNLPYIELVERIEKEAEENVMLEVERGDELFEVIKYINSGKKVKKEADFTDVPGLKNIADTSKTLEATLLQQLELEDLSKVNEEIAGLLIESINDRGYIENYTEVRDGIIKKLGVSRPTVDKMLKLIQTFEPDGVGARDLKECLLIQIREYNFENFELEKVLTSAVSKHLDDIAKRDFKKVSKSMGIPVPGVERLAEFIRANLNPHPAASFSTEAVHVIPSFSIEKTDKGFEITNLERNCGPLLKISPQYLKMLEDPKTDAETLKFLRQKLSAAKDLMEDLARRHETMERIVEKIKATQLDFFSKGKTFLKPLLQKDLAQEFGIHPSTVSRAIASKYIQTPKGLFRIKLLCPRSHKGLTPLRIKTMIAEIIGQENRQKPLTDENIKTLLMENGADVTRRTIALYRQEIGIAKTSKRKK